MCVVYVVFCLSLIMMFFSKACPFLLYFICVFCVCAFYMSTHRPKNHGSVTPILRKCNCKTNESAFLMAFYICHCCLMYIHFFFDTFSIQAFQLLFKLTSDTRRKVSEVLSDMGRLLVLLTSRKRTSVAHQTTYI